MIACHLISYSIYGWSVVRYSIADGKCNCLQVEVKASHLGGSDGRGTSTGVNSHSVLGERRREGDKGREREESSTLNLRETNIFHPIIPKNLQRAVSDMQVLFLFKLYFEWNTLLIDISFSVRWQEWMDLPSWAQCFWVGSEPRSHSLHAQPSDSEPGKTGRRDSQKCW